MNIQLEHGTVLVIVGAQGSEKSALAEGIAAQYGSVATVDSMIADESLVLWNEPDTVIFDGIIYPKCAALIRSLIEHPTHRVNRKYQMPKEVKSPFVVVTTCDEYVVNRLIRAGICHFNTVILDGRAQ